MNHASKQIKLSYFHFNVCSLGKNKHKLDQWLSTFFVLVHPFKLVRKPVRPCHCTKI